MISVEDFAAQADAWFAEHTPRGVPFMLPLTFMEVGTDEQFDFLRDWQNQVYRAGYLGAHWPTDYGGGGLTQKHQDAATRVMRKYNVPIMLNAIGIGWAGPLILDTGTEDEKRKYLPGILSADDIWCQGFSEPDNGSDLGNAQLKAVRDGDEYVLNGSKTWTTQGNYAKYMILLARTDFDAPNKYAGLSFFLAPMRIPGVETTKIRKLTGEYGFTQTFFTDARIPADTLMGQEGEGWKVAMRTLEYERGARGGQAGGYTISQTDPLEVVGLAKRATRNGQPALEDPVMRDRLMAQMIEGQAMMANRERAKIMPLVMERPFALPMLSKLQFTEYARETGELALELEGAQSGYYVGEAGSREDGYWQRSYLNAFSATIGGGTSQIQRNIVGEHVLGLPKTR
ncbi:acyl-CoA dehydrogenase family protein [Algimonas porphyrae]|uniref:Acyl-CoA dehydrogenase FadE17 n=1 Tax=Algimonas porphyrae TaxID=1128113 RepID=A0ABQ5V2V7_9PROT|nr:acyl-CoA dehydrogenase family protein [Algimonas porphyrae]GLQ21808.1 putative acyl-CoA dehydrogenase FadE17 [Algimonas porphyrae]